MFSWQSALAVSIATTFCISANNQHNPPIMKVPSFPAPMQRFWSPDVALQKIKNKKKQRTLCCQRPARRRQPERWYAPSPAASTQKVSVVNIAMHPEEMGRVVCPPPTPHHHPLSHMQPSAAISWHSYVWHNATRPVYTTVWGAFLDARFSAVTSQRSKRLPPTSRTAARLSGPRRAREVGGRKRVSGK